MNQKSPRTFDDKPAALSQVPLLIGLFGPSGAGKTFSGLRLATGIQSVTGGDIFVIDTESRRALHYADRFKFRHIEFGAPFGSLDYLAALQHCVGKGAGVVIVDSMSHEHEGKGGYLATHEAELDRLAGSDWRKRQSVNFLAWAKPSGERRQLINGLLQLNANFIFCFRAKEKIKPVRGGEPIELGWMPIAGEEFLYEQTVSALLLPGAQGVPTWRPERVGERTMVKLPEQFRALFEESRPLDEATGRTLAEWARGGAAPLARPPAPAGGGKLWDKAVAIVQAEGMTGLAEKMPRLKPDQREYLQSRWTELQALAEPEDDGLGEFGDGLADDGPGWAEEEAERRRSARTAAPEPVE